MGTSKNRSSSLFEFLEGVASGSAHLAIIALLTKDALQREMQLLLLSVL